MRCIVLYVQHIQEVRRIHCMDGLQMCEQSELVSRQSSDISRQLTPQGCIIGTPDFSNASVSFSQLASDAKSFSYSQANSYLSK